MDNNFRDKVKQIQKECRTTLYIGRVPEKVKTKFKQWCNEEFEGDYGMGLKTCFEQSQEYQKVKRHLFKLIEENEKNL